MRFILFFLLLSLSSIGCQKSPSTEGKLEGESTSCYVAHNSPGCKARDIQECVCGNGEGAFGDEFCCARGSFVGEDDAVWGEACVNEAIVCLSRKSTGNDCFAVQTKPGCDDTGNSDTPTELSLSILKCVCNENRPEYLDCCESSWAQECVDLAGNECRP